MQTQTDDDLIAEALEFLRERKKYANCIACGEKMKAGKIMICPECLGERIDEYLLAVGMEEDA